VTQEEISQRVSERLRVWWRENRDGAGAELSRQRAFKRYHRDFHVNRNKPNPLCRLCQKDHAIDELTIATQQFDPTQYRSAYVGEKHEA
jgi:hypothetical protein